MLRSLKKTQSGMLASCRYCPGIRGKLRCSRGRRFAFVLSLVAAASCALFAACSPVDSAGTIPRSKVHAPRAAHRLTVMNAMLFEVGENPLEKKSVSIPVGEYVFEGEDDIFLYFRAPELMEYRVYHKEGYAEGAFQLGGLALARIDKWDKIEYPACTYIDGEDQHQKRLTCPLEISFLLNKRGIDWESDFDKGETVPVLKTETQTDENSSEPEQRTQTDENSPEPEQRTQTDENSSEPEQRTQTETDAISTVMPVAVPVAVPQTQSATETE